MIRVPGFTFLPPSVGLSKVAARDRGSKCSLEREKKKKFCPEAPAKSTIVRRMKIKKRAKKRKGSQAILFSGSQKKGQKRLGGESEGEVKGAPVSTQYSEWWQALQRIVDVLIVGEWVGGEGTMENSRRSGVEIGSSNNYRRQVQRLQK